MCAWSRYSCYGLFFEISCVVNIAGFDCGRALVVATIFLCMWLCLLAVTISFSIYCVFFIHSFIDGRKNRSALYTSQLSR